MPWWGSLEQKYYLLSGCRQISSQVRHAFSNDRPLEGQHIAKPSSSCSSKGVCVVEKCNVLGVSENSISLGEGKW